MCSRLRPRGGPLCPIAVAAANILSSPSVWRARSRIVRPSGGAGGDPGEGPEVSRGPRAQENGKAVDHAAPDATIKPALSQDDLIRALARGGTIALDGGEVVLDRFVTTVKPVPPKERTAALVAKTPVEIVNGTLRCAGPAFALVARGGAKVKLSGVTVVGGGVASLDAGTRLELRECAIRDAQEHCGAVCSDRAQMTLWDTDVARCEVAGVVAAGEGARVTMQGGSITGSVTSHGAACQAGGHLELRGVRVADCRRVGVAVTGAGSRALVDGGSVAGSLDSHGAAGQNGVALDLRGVRIEDCKVTGLLVHGRGSTVDFRGGTVTGAKESHGVACQEGAVLQLSDVEVADCRLAGVFAHGEGSRVTVQGGSIRGCGCNDVVSRLGASAAVNGTLIG